MIRQWLGVALLSAYWLFGLPYVQPASGLLALVCAVTGAVLLSGSPVLRVGRGQLASAAACFLPAIWWLPWPYRAAPLLLTVGLVLLAVPVPTDWPRAAGRGALWAGTILLSQAVCLEIYQYQTARCHDLPAPLLAMVTVPLRLAGVDATASVATANGAAIVMHAFGGTHRLAGTWELLIDPATYCFAIGGLVLLGLSAAAHLPREQRWLGWLAGARALVAAIAVWLPLRASFVIALYLHRVLVEQPEAGSLAANQFVNAWTYVLLLIGPMLLAARFVRLPWASATTEGGRALPPVAHPSGQSTRPGRMAASLVLVGASIAVLTAGWKWTPVGERQEGRVMVVERHSTWEPTTRPYDTEWFGEIASYNYSAAFDYLSQYYRMSRLLETDRIDEDALAECDVLVIKIPTARYQPGEVEAVCRFVNRGGALLLVGDHTNVFNCNTYLNDISRHFGFTFRNDLLFRVGSPYKQHYQRPMLPHPCVQHVPEMDFAVSCSIDPGSSGGEMVLRSTGLWNLPPDYNASNFHPQAEYRPDMQLGAFCQAWATTHGNGRVLAFTDSTLFSSFCTFQEGKAQMLRSMIEYLNHRSPFDRFWLRRTVVVCAVLLAAALLAGAIWFGWGQPVFWGFPLAAGVLGWSVAVAGVALVHRAALPVPTNERPMTHVVVDRSISEVPLSLGAFPQGDGDGYGLLEQWIPRLGNYTSRARGPERWKGDALVIIEPTRSVPRSYRDALVNYVEAGGHVLIVDSPDNGRTSVNSLIWPFGMQLSHAASQSGALRIVDDWPGVELEAGSRVLGGEPIAWIDELPVAAQAQRGQGVVTVVGFGFLFRDAAMGGHWMPDPDAPTRARYEILFSLLEAAIEGRPPDPKWVPASGPAADPPPPRGDESGGA